MGSGGGSECERDRRDGEKGIGREIGLVICVVASV